MTLAEAIASAVPRLTAVSDSPRQDAEYLLAAPLALSRAQLFSRLDQPLSPDMAVLFERSLARRARGEPVAYILGERGFWTFSLKVTPAVLVPRPETEGLVAWALEVLDGRSTPKVVDLGTGSGAIALALACERPDARVTAIDLSPEALTVAAENGQRLQLAVRWEQADFGDWLHRPGDRLDLIVSNPPYVAAQDPHLAALRFEPAMALTDGHDGLNALRSIIAAAPRRLQSGGWLLLEHGHDQGVAVRQLLTGTGFAAIETRRDLAGLERLSGGRWDA